MCQICCVRFWTETNIISEPLEFPCGRGHHNYAVIISRGAERISFHHNIISQSAYRNPLIGGSGSVDNNPPQTKIEVINNIVHNGGYGSLEITGNDIAIVGEYHTGPAPSCSSEHCDISGIHNWISTVNSNLYLHDNVNPKRTSDSQSESDAFYEINTGAVIGNRSFSSNVTVSGARDNFASLMEMDGNIPKVGAYPRDTTDTRIINDIKTDSGSWVTNIDYPTYIESHRSSNFDTDHDGIPDSWEQSHSSSTNALNPHSMRDGYSELEHYINHFFETNEAQSAPAQTHQ